MRNLKKVLSLSLSLVMLLGLMMVGAGAATTYTDADDITYTEAVDVMSAVGVFNGTDSGDFQPNGDLTREQAAKIICYMLMGQTAADALTTNTAPFQDVAANRWSAGSIAYCVTMGIVAGDGNGRFYPTQTVTGYQFAKMLLVALGYDATVEQYTGTNWAINVASDAAAADLTVGLDASLSNTMTREQACQMAFNAMKANMVNYSSKGTNITTSDGTTIAMGASDAEPIVSSRATIADDGYLQFAEQYLSDLVLTSSGVGTDDFGRPANVWTYNDDEVGTYAKTADFTYTADTSSSTLSSALRGYTVDATVTVNGDVQTGTVASVSGLADLTGNGTVVELFADKRVITDVVVIETEYATVSRIVTTSGRESVTLTGGVQITLEDQPDLYNVVSGLEVGDAVLLVANADDEALAVSIPEVVSGEFTRINSSDNTYTVGGNAYGLSDSYSNTDVFDGNNLTTVYDLTLDNYGYIIYAVESALTDNADYALVLDNSYSGNVMSGITKYVQLLYTDGTIEWVQVATVGGKAVKNDTSDAVTDNTFVAYVENSDGTYALSTVGANKAITSTTSGASSSTNIAGYSFTTGNNTTPYFNVIRNDINFLQYSSTSATEGFSDVDLSGSNSTIFLIGNTSRGFTVYTGIRNVAAQNGASGYILANDTVAKIVVINTGSAATSTDKVYIAGNYSSAYRDSDLGTVRTYPAVVNGEITTVDVVANSNTVTVGKMYTSVIYNGDIIETIGSPVSATYDGSGVDTAQTASNNDFEYSSGILTIDGTTAIGADNVTFYAAVNDEVTTITAAAFNALSDNAVDEIEGTADLVVTYDDDGFVTAVYVSYNEPGEEEETVANVTISDVTLARSESADTVVVTFESNRDLAATTEAVITLYRISDYTGGVSSLGSESVQITAAVDVSTDATGTATSTITIPATGTYYVTVQLTDASDAVISNAQSSVEMYLTTFGG